MKTYKLDCKMHEICLTDKPALLYSMAEWQNAMYDPINLLLEIVYINIVTRLSYFKGWKRYDSKCYWTKKADRTCVALTPWVMSLYHELYIHDFSIYVFMCLKTVRFQLPQMKVNTLDIML